MVWLSFHMWLLLLGAFLLGLFFGWWIWRERRQEIVHAATGAGMATAGDKPDFDASAGTRNNLVSQPSVISEGKKPKLYTSESQGPKDDLKKIRGIGPAIEKLLHSLGIYYYEQIASWEEDEVTWVDSKLQFPGRIVREEWVEQAKILKGGGETEFAQRYEKGETPSSYSSKDNKTDGHDT